MLNRKKEGPHTRQEIAMHCAFCETAVVVKDRVGFRDECSQCEGDLHICLNCRFYDTHSSRQCLEPAISEAVKDKERRNLCEYFKPTAHGSDDKGESTSEAARKQLEALFK